jgi:hypothetical protein
MSVDFLITCLKTIQMALLIMEMLLIRMSTAAAVAAWVAHPSNAVYLLPASSTRYC